MTDTNDPMANVDSAGLTQATIPPSKEVTATSPVQDANLYQLATLSIHADDPLNILTDVAPPLHVSTTFRYASDPSQLRPFRPADRPGAPIFPHQETPSEHCYSRLTTHSTSRFETILTSLLKNPCVTYSSGLSALHAFLTHLVPKRVSIGAGYHGCRGVLRLHTRLAGTTVLPLDCADDDLHRGDLIILETPINPTGLALDIAHYAKKAHDRGAYLCVDSTFAPPPLQDPFVQGADVVMHSGTKYFGGHSDMLCGVLSVRKDLALPGGEGGKEGWISRLIEDREYIGAVMGGLEGWLGVRSVRTMELRVTRQSETATKLVRALSQALDGVSGEETLLNEDERTVIGKVMQKVQHASLQKRDLEDGWLRNQMPGGFGPVFAITLKSGDLARHLPSKLRLFHHATSLGGVESLIEWRTMSDATVGTDVLRVSVGIEHFRDLLDDFLQAFRALIADFDL